MNLGGVHASNDVLFPDDSLSRNSFFYGEIDEPWGLEVSGQKLFYTFFAASCVFLRGSRFAGKLLWMVYERGGMVWKNPVRCLRLARFENKAR